MDVMGRLRNSVDRLRQNVSGSSMIAYPFNFAMLSHVGRVRKGNEDTCAASIETGAFVVCDGMGGAAAGEVASQLAAETFLVELRLSDAESLEALPQTRLNKAIHAANRAVFQQSQRAVEMRGMGTTLVALLLTPEETTGRPELTLAHVGDSRCYRFRDDVLEQLTVDHSLVEEQVRAGELTEEQAEYHPYRNIITRAIGSQPRVEAEIQQVEAQPGDLYLLASDGLTRELTDEDIARMIRTEYARSQPETEDEAAPKAASAESSSAVRAHTASSVEVERIRESVRGFDLAGLCQVLVGEANEAGGADNITVMLVTIR